MRRLFVAILALAAAAAAQSGRASAAGQTPASPRLPASKAAGGQAVPTFRAGTDLLTLDVSVLDNAGRPVEGLVPGDFTVKIGGRTRRVVAAELVKVDAGAPPVEDISGKPKVTRVDTGGRRILIAVDQQYIPPGSIKPFLNAGADFIGRLTPRDQAAFVAFPAPGPHVDFTTDKARVRQAMQELVGQPSRMAVSGYGIGLAEALIVNDMERFLVNETDPAAIDPPVIGDIMARSDCLSAADDKKLACRRQIVAESVQMAGQARDDAKISIRTLESIIGQLAKVEGTKSLILVSASMMIDNRHDLDMLIHLATVARVSLAVIVVDAERERMKVSPGQTNQQPTELADRRLIAEGLEELAADGRGAVFRLAGSGEGIYERIGQELSASYVLGVESRPEDLKGDIDKVEVTIPRRRFKVRVSQAFARAPMPAPLAPRSLDEDLRSALASPSALTDLKMQVATFSQWDPASGRIRVKLAAEVGQPGIQAGDYIVGYVVADREGRTIVDWSEKQALSTPGKRGSAQPFGEPLLLEPGVYTLRLGIVDSSGRQGTVIRELHVQRSTSGGLPTSDLLVGPRLLPGQTLGLSAEPRVTGGIAAYLELYSAMPEDLDWTFVHFEIAKDATSPALATEQAEMVEGAQPSWRVATAFVDSGTLAPGPYLARARVVRDDKTVGVVTRPFWLERPRAPATLPAAK